MTSPRPSRARITGRTSSAGRAFIGPLAGAWRPASRKGWSAGRPCARSAAAPSWMPDELAALLDVLTRCEARGDAKRQDWFGWDLVVDRSGSLVGGGAAGPDQQHLLDAHQPFHRAADRARFRRGLDGGGGDPAARSGAAGGPEPARDPRRHPVSPMGGLL